MSTRTTSTTLTTMTTSTIHHVNHDVVIYYYHGEDHKPVRSHYNRKLDVRRQSIRNARFETARGQSFASTSILGQDQGKVSQLKASVQGGISPLDHGVAKSVNWGWKSTPVFGEIRQPPQKEKTEAQEVQKVQSTHGQGCGGQPSLDLSRSSSAGPKEGHQEGVSACSGLARSLSSTEGYPDHHLHLCGPLYRGQADPRLLRRPGDRLPGLPLLPPRWETRQLPVPNSDGVQPKILCLRLVVQRGLQSSWRLLCLERKHQGIYNSTSVRSPIKAKFRSWAFTCGNMSEFWPYLIITMISIMYYVYELFL